MLISRSKLLVSFSVAFCVAIFVTACGGGTSPVTPTGLSPQVAPVIVGNIGVKVDAACSQAPFSIQAVTVFVDGASIGGAKPGFTVTAPFPVGPHTIVARANTKKLWDFGTVVTTADKPDSLQTAVCQ